MKDLLGGNMTNIAIVGSRDFNDFELLDNRITSWLKQTISIDRIVIVSGGAKGADTLAEKFADKYGFEKLIYRANWDIYGKRAGFIRNRDIIKCADIVFAFWDGESKGTKNSIDLANEQRKRCITYYYKGDN